MKFKGAALKLTSDDITRAGNLIGVGEDEIHAVIEVEAAGSGFDPQGRPKMLFEPHVFYRNLSGAKRDRAVADGLAYKDWKRGAYPKDSYPRLTRACEIDETAALKSASWGMGQVLGENHKAAGYPDPQSMVRAFCESEGTQLLGMVAFIKYNKLDDNLRAHDWRGFALGYNGKSYEKHGYHIKLMNAYEKWARIPDTPLGKDVPPLTLPPDVPVPKPGPAPKRAPTPKPKPKTKTDVAIGTGGAIVVGTGTAAAAKAGIPWEIIAPLIALGVTVVIGAILWRHRKA